MGKSGLSIAAERILGPIGEELKALRLSQKKGELPPHLLAHGIDAPKELISWKTLDDVSSLNNYLVNTYKDDKKKGRWLIVRIGRDSINKLENGMSSRFDMLLTYSNLLGYDLAGSLTPHCLDFKREVGVLTQRLNASFCEVQGEGRTRQHARILYALEDPPTTEEVAAPAPEESVRVCAREHEGELEALGRPNDWIALIPKDSLLSWDLAPDHLRYARYRYATLKAMREQAKEKALPPPLVLSSSAVFVCPKQRELILQIRSQDKVKSKGVDTYQGLHHTIGGAMQPQEKNYGETRLEDTIIRELHEETRLAATFSDVKIMMMEEPLTGFVQCVFLGITATNFKLSRDNWEGRRVGIPFDELEEYLTGAKSGQWVPTGKLHVLSWLMLGAPGCEPGERFGKRTAHQLLEAYLIWAEEYGEPSIKNLP